MATVPTIPKKILDALGTGVTITSTDLDIRDLAKTQDSVAIWTNTAKDGTGTDYQPLADADGHLQVDVLSGGGGLNDDFMKYLSDNGVFKSESLLLSDGVAAVYTVPANKIFYLIGFSFYWKVAVGTTSEDLRVYVNELTAFRVRTSNTVDDFGFVTQAFTVPVKLIATERVAINCGSSTINCCCTASGYELDA